MILFDFKCEDCGHEGEALVKSDVYILNCAECMGVETYKRLTMGTKTFNFKGDGTYDQGKVEHGRGKK